MNKNQKKFIRDSGKIAFNLEHRDTINYNISKYNFSFNDGLKRYDNLNDAKSSAALIKRQVLQNLPEYLEEFELSAKQNGIEVFWAETAKDAILFLKHLITTSGIESVIKSKSMTSEEINLNQELEGIGVRVVETDLGEFIVQKAGEKPYHILTPAMHKSREDIGLLFNKLYGTPINATAEWLTSFVKNILRGDLESCRMGITGANFIIAKEGAIVLTENEGNGLFTCTYPETHVVIAGIEKVLPTVNDLDLFLPLLASHATGQLISTYNSVIFGPRKEREANGPNRMIVILLDNGRSNLYSKSYQSEALSCIRCGACLNCCPVYKNIGGHAYNTVYTGPIGSVISPHLKPFKEFKHLSYASTLCGRCYEVCPVKINIPQLLLYNRKESVDTATEAVRERLTFSAFDWIMRYPERLNWIGGFLRRNIFTWFYNSLMGKKREFKKMSPVTFKSKYLNNRFL